MASQNPSQDASQDAPLPDLPPSYLADYSDQTPNTQPDTRTEPQVTDKTDQIADQLVDKMVSTHPSSFSHIKSSPVASQIAKQHPKQTSTLSSLPSSSQNMTDSALLRILDANLDRAREGMRILEEWCRFGLNDESTTEQFKHLRQSIASWHSSEIRLARNTPGDAGTALTHPQEAQRSGLNDVLQANFARTQEALRVLEEYGKLYSVEMAAACKQFRYQLYTLDSQILGPMLAANKSATNQSTTNQSVDFKQRMQQLLAARTYLVTSPVPNFLETVEAALKGGIAIVQYREKTADDETRLTMAKRLRSLCHQYGALFIVNDRVDIAAAADADGVHLGQQDLPMEIARQILGPDKIVGRSTTNPAELERALGEGADYIGVGPVHETPTKPGKAAAGNDYVRYAAQHASMPWFTIGGLNADNLQPTLAAGATRVAVVRALMEADNPETVARSLVEQTQQAILTTPSAYPSA